MATRSIGIGLSASLLVMLGSAVSAQSPIEGVLQSEAQTPPQRAMGELIEDICPLGVVGVDLQARCDEVVVAVLQSGDVNGAREGLQAMANEEGAVIATTEVDASNVQMDTINSRLGNGGGGSGVTLEFNGDQWLYGAPTGLAAGDTGATGLSVFVNISYGTGDRDTTPRETGFDLDSWGVTGGLEYSLSDQALVGVAAGYTNIDSDLDANSGSLSSDNYSFLGYVGYYPSDNTYLNAILGYSATDHDQKRTVAYSITSLFGPTVVNQVALSDTESDEFLISVSGGYDFYRDSWSFGPYGRFDHADTNIDGYRERMSNPTAAGSGLALAVADQDVTSNTLAIGGQAMRSIQTSWGYIYPQINLEWVHEFDNDAEDTVAIFVDDPTATRLFLATDPPDRDYGNVGVGAIATFGRGHSVFARYQGLLGYSDLDLHVFEVGIKFAL
jgi:uncharacterized protein with beta-barrel porin domain